MTAGTHYLHFDAHHVRLSTTFLPLVYLMCKQVETGSATTLGSAHMLLDSLNAACEKAFGRRLEPGAGMSDHCAAYRNAYARAFPAMPFGQCYPHIARKLGEGEYVKKTWQHLDAVQVHVRAIHLAVTSDMRDLLLEMIGPVWDKWGKQMDTFWDSNCVEPWNNWSVGLFDAPLCTPSNNAQEAWHRDLLRARIPGMFRGSTEHVFRVALPQLVQMDGLLKPTTIPFEVPAIPPGMLENALWYVNHQATHVYAFDSDGKSAFFLLSKAAASKSGTTKITARLIEMFGKAMRGEKDARVKDLDTLIAVCQSLHVVCKPEEYEVLKCQGNPSKYECLACKSFKGVGICSHVLAVNHILSHFNVRYELKSIQTAASKKAAAKGGNTYKPAPALKRARVAEPDSSDEEEERLLALGQQGK
jgi:hypothetical protein